MQLIDLAAQLDEAPVHVARDGRDLCLGVRQELVQRRIEQANRHRHAGELAEDAFEVGFLERQQLVERLAASCLVAREDHFAHVEDALLGEEHVLRAAKTDAVRAEEACDARVVRRVGVCADAEGSDLVCGAEEAIEVAIDLGLLGFQRSFEQHLHDLGRSRGELAAEDLAGRAVDREPVAFLERLVAFAAAQFALLIIDTHAARADDAGTAHAARNDRGVRGESAARGEDSRGAVHAGDVLG